MDSFGKQLIAARKAKGMTQDQLAAALNVSRSTVSSWERGRTMPNMNFLRVLTALLGCDFLQEQGVAGPEPDTPPTEVAGDAEEAENVEETLPPPAEMNNMPDEDRPRRLDRRAIVIAALLVCVAAVCAFLILRPAPDSFPIAQYRQQTPDDPERAFLSFTSNTWEEQGGNTTYARYAFTLSEHNGKPFSVTRVEVCYDSPKHNDRTFILTADDLRQNGLEPDIPAYGSLALDGGFPKGDFIRAGIAVYGEDADGAANVFYYLIEL